MAPFLALFLMKFFKSCFSVSTCFDSLSKGFQKLGLYEVISHIISQPLFLHLMRPSYGYLLTRKKLETSSPVFRNEIDTLKEEMNEAHYQYECLLDSDTERDLSYKWFDVRDREFTEERLKICEALQQLERESFSHRSSVTSVSKSGSKSRRSQISRARSRAASSLSLPQAHADATAMARKLQVEMAFLEKDKEVKRMQLEKEKTFSEFLSQEVKHAIKTEIKHDRAETDQQRSINLPIKEPPVFFGDCFEYPSFTTAFDSIIASSVKSDIDRLFFGKLPSYAGVKWCRIAHERQQKERRAVGFKEFVAYVKLEAELANDPVFSDLDTGTLPLQRTLGVQWCVKSDSFQFSIVLRDKPCTSRGILSTVSSKLSQTSWHRSRAKDVHLPEGRLEPCAPFTYCTVDLFGPFTIKENRKILKRDNL
ncbi:predicted protein [Nematostella vectensis]|uniref:Uncharacterized protein n=1 Tax=Nematostella vectensis TaxID=45351 RepID=A7SX47_NEMVE|nr:predicted protein [Nematostella vectensis]|eukprot:XP_001623827.1 predicted protein [Nematostella vectensis]